jgi:hypothetical protein
MSRARIVRYRQGKADMRRTTHSQLLTEADAATVSLNVCLQG